MELDPTVWGPHYWFMLHTTALTYPIHPNATTKKKYYDFIYNLPLFIPHRNISNAFADVLVAWGLTETVVTVPGPAAAIDDPESSGRRKR